MRKNVPVSRREFEIDGGVTLMSATDTSSHLAYANAAFVHVSGFDREELLGQPHNLVRHPDMPAEAFADMWATLQVGQSWTGLVKNRRKNGDHYWVRANATPIKRYGSTVGYMSVRTKPGRGEIDAAEKLYQTFREGRAGARTFHKGLVVRAGWLKWTSLTQVLPTCWRVRLGVMGMALLGTLAAVFLGGASWTIAAVMLLLALATSLWIEQQVTGPLKSLLSSAELIAAGQAVEIAPLNRVDDIGMLGRAINQAGLNLRSLLDDVSLQVDGINTASAEIAQGNADLSARTEQSAASLEETAASMAQMTSTVTNNANHARQAEALARHASKSAEDGRQEFLRVTNTMGQIQASSKRIADIISLIESIAFQTNILALNAAVEAARAGDQGRGFAVVATEVRGLAQRSATAAKNIKALIEDSVRCVAEGDSLVKRAGETMNVIVTQAHQVSSLISEIASATSEQAQGIVQVDMAVNQLDQTTQQNAALVEQSAAAATCLQQQATRLGEAIGAFRLKSA
jgi:aerotaxis receptor